MNNIADKIKLSQDKDGMLRRALERIIQLYTDKSHFVYELLQNAEDVGATNVKFVQYDDRLEVYHDGKPFTVENLQGLCDIGKSDKVNNLNQIGEFGVGFKSVFGICDTVKLYSSPEYYMGDEYVEAEPFAIEIVDFTRPEPIEYIKVDGGYTTKFIFPYSIGRTFSGFKSFTELKNTLSRKLENLGITTLLFMKSMESIKYEIHTDKNETSGEYMLEKNEINNHCSLVSAIGISDDKDDEEISYLMFSKKINDASLRTVDIAFPITVNDNGDYIFQHSINPYISVYFPTETESKLDFIVQGPYRTTPNRSSIPADDQDNIQLALETAQLLQTAILELKASNKLNMSFVKLLPVSEKAFANYALFLPLYETVKTMFHDMEIIPTNSGKYTTAKRARIARQDKLADLFTDSLLSKLINDGRNHFWLPTFLTETNREYESVYRFLTTELKIDVVRPEELRTFFTANPTFLPKMDNEWLIKLYSILENVGAAFSRSRNETNMLTADIIKTSTGAFVAPFRRTDNRQYVPNVFVPVKNIKIEGINFVDEYLYDNCRHFFDEVLQIQKPNEYEYFVKDFKSRASNPYAISSEQHVQDVKQLIKYLKNYDYQGEVSQLVKDYLYLKCSDNGVRNPYTSAIYLPISRDGINIEAYYKNISRKITYVNVEFYADNDISLDALCSLGIKDSIFIGEDIVKGVYDTGSRGHKPDWWTSGPFRWKFSLDAIKDVLQYISRHPDANDSILKSQAIMHILMLHEDMLVGTVRIGGSTQNLVDETCELLKVLKLERYFDWNGKWIYTNSMDLVSPKTISKHEINQAIYGKFNSDSILFDTLNFKKTAADEADDLRKTATKQQLDAFFESELKKRYGISTFDLEDVYTKAQVYNEDKELYEFPIGRIKSWATLRKHAAEMMVYANPAKYEFVVRKVRTSNNARETREYLKNIYRYDYSHQFACQMCHEPTSSIEATGLFEKPDTELDPMNLCLCPNCASNYRYLRNKPDLMDKFKDDIIGTSEDTVVNGDQVIINIDEYELWFSQTHFAEINELLKLKKDAEDKKYIENKDISPDSTNEKSGISVYNEYVGRIIKRRFDNFKAEILAVDDKLVTVKVIEGKEAGTIKKYDIAAVFGAQKIYSFI